jgi:hypothetical protein
LLFSKIPYLAGFELPHLIVLLAHTLSGDLSGHDTSAVKLWLRYLVYKGWQVLSSNFHFFGICGPYQRTVGGRHATQNIPTLLIQTAVFELRSQLCA